MTTDPTNVLPPASNLPPPGTPPARRHWLGRALLGVLLTLVCLAALAGATLYGAIHTARGTRLAWQAAQTLAGGRLHGQYVGGSLERGLRLAHVDWHDGPTRVQIDFVTGQWALTRAPWRLTVDFLHAGTVEVQTAPSTDNTPLSLPRSLKLPLQLSLRQIRIDHLKLHSTAGSAAVTELSNLALHGNSDGLNHALTVDTLATPYGSLSATLSLAGVRPFKLTGAIGFAGKVAADPVEVSARLAGSLEQLSADVDASGKQLAGRAHIEAMPFGAVPLKVVTLAADHVNLQAFNAAAPQADLSLRARLEPVVPAAAPGHSTAAPPAEVPLVVAGAVSIVNAQAGPLSAHRLPLLNAQAQVRLDAQHQTVSGLSINLFGGGTLNGDGNVVGGAGRFDLQLAGLDLHLLQSQLRPTRLAGPLTIVLDTPGPSLKLDLSDPKAGLRIRSALRLDPDQITLDNTRLDAGSGHADFSAVLKRDASSSYTFKAGLGDFDPFAILVQQTGTAALPHLRGTAPEPDSRKVSAAATPPPHPHTAATAAIAASGATPSRPATAAPATPAMATHTPPRNRARGPVVARITGNFEAQGTLAQLTAKATLSLRNSVYDGLPLTGGGTVQLAGERLLPSNLQLSIAGNQLDVHGAFGARGDSLAFRLDAPRIDRLGLGLAGTVLAEGRVMGNLTHPNVSANYSADALVLGDYRLGHAQGRAELHDGAGGALALSLDATDLNSPQINLHTVSADLAGTRANHTLTLHALGTVQGQALDLDLAAHGKLTDTAAGSGWDGEVTQAVNRGLPALQLIDPVSQPLTVSLSAGRVALGAARFSIEGASFDLKQFLFDHGKIQTAGSATNLDIDRLLQIQRDITGANPPLKTDMIFDGDWDFSLGNTASGYLQFKRRSGDVTLNTWRGAAAMGVSELAARVDFSGGNQARLSLKAAAARIGTVDAQLQTVLIERDGLLSLADEAPLTGTVQGDIPELRTTGGLFGPAYVLDGRLVAQLKVAGQIAHPKLTGSVTGNNLSATLIDQGIQFKQGVIRIALEDNLVQFQQVEFHGASGTLSASGRIKLDQASPDLAVNIQADKLELFATPDRQLQLSGQATVHNAAAAAGVAGGIAIDGKFKVDRALFDLPESAAPELGSDVHIIKQDGTEVSLHKPIVEQVQKQAEQPAGSLAPSAHIAIDLGDSFRFKGAGADLGLSGKIVASSSPNQPLRAVGNVSVTSGSTYTSFGRKLSIDSGFFTFNGPIDNPGISILALRHNQEVEAGVQVSGTVQAPVVKLVSEPTVADNEKLSWLLFGHGTDTGTNLGQQSTMTEAFALLGNAGGKRIAQTLGLDEFSIGQSEVGLTDPQVVTLSKALNERLVLGYEQGLTTAASVFKVTLNLSRFWAVAVHTGAVNGATLLYNRRFD